MDIFDLFIWSWVIAIGGTALFCVGGIVLAIVAAVVSVALPIFIVGGILWLGAAIMGNVL